MAIYDEKKTLKTFLFKKESLMTFKLRIQPVNYIHLQSYPKNNPKLTFGMFTPVSNSWPENYLI